jgi:hypothetical protein
MDMVILLLANGFFLSFVLLVFLILFSTQNGNKHKKKKVKEDIDKIKDQTNGN